MMNIVWLFVIYQLCRIYRDWSVRRYNEAAARHNAALAKELEDIE